MTQTLTRSTAEPAGRPAARRGAVAAMWGRGRLRILGIVFLCLLLLAVWLTYALFTKKFTHYDEVSLRTDRIGLQLPERADVKIRGVIVGEVLDMHATDTGATLELGIYPDQMHTIPADVTGAILPKTLFGEKYVSLVAPTDHVRQHLQPGAVIERTQVSTELQQVLADIYPLLRTIQPADLNETLNAVATALEGRGEQIGTTLETLNDYLKRFNPQVPALIRDLRMATEVADTYSDALPEISQILRDSLVTTTTLEDRSQQLHDLLTNVTSFSDTADRFLVDNGDNLIQLGRVSEPVARTLARYSPEFPCLLQGLVDQAPRLASTFRGFIFHIDLITLPHQPRGYTAKDAPVLGADNGPACLGLPRPQVPFRNVPNFDDGVNNLQRGDAQRTAPHLDAALSSAAAGDAQKAFWNSLTAPVLGVPYTDVPDLTSLLFAPLATGTEVSVR